MNATCPSNNRLYARKKKKSKDAKKVLEKIAAHGEGSRRESDEREKEPGESSSTTTRSGLTKAEHSFMKMQEKKVI